VYPYVWLAVLMLALYGLVAAFLDLTAWLGSRNGPTPGVPLVSVLVLIKNGEDVVERFLRRLCGIGISGTSVPYEVVAVDDYSTDQTWSIVRRLESSSRVLKAVRMGDVAAPGESPESIGLFMCSGDVAIVCRLGENSDARAILSTVKTMLNRPRKERLIAYLAGGHRFSGGIWE